MSKKRKNDIRRIITITPVEFKTVKREEEFVSMTALRYAGQRFRCSDGRDHDVESKAGENTGSD